MSQLDRDDILQRMSELFDEYDIYDLTGDIIVAWKNHIRKYYEDTSFNTLYSVGTLDNKGNFQSKADPDCTILFPPESKYAIIGEIKASFSTGSHNLEALESQLRKYDETRFIFRPDSDPNSFRTAETQDIMLIVGAKSASAVANHLKALPEFQKNIVICQFVEEHEAESRVLYFSRFPHRAGRDSLRDGFLENRISHFLDKRIELRIKDVIEHRDFYIAASDDVKNEKRLLGPAVKLFIFLRQHFGKRFRVDAPGDARPSVHVECTISDIVVMLSKPPYICRLSHAQIRRIFELVSKSSQSICQIEGDTIKVAIPIPKRFGNYRDIQGNLKRKHAMGDLPYLCFHLARGLLLEEKEKKERAQKVAARKDKQLPLFN